MTPPDVRQWGQAYFVFYTGSLKNWTHDWIKAINIDLNKWRQTVSGSVRELDELAHNCFWMYHSSRGWRAQHTSHIELSSSWRWGTRTHWTFPVFTGRFRFAGWWPFHLLLGFSLCHRIFMQKKESHAKEKIEHSKVPWEFRDQVRRFRFAHRHQGWKQGFLWEFNRGSGLSSGLFIAFVCRFESWPSK